MNDFAPPLKPVDPRHTLPEMEQLVPASKNIEVRKPNMQEVGQIMNLINTYAQKGIMLARGPQYLYENIRNFVVAVDTSAEVMYADGSKAPLVVACGGLHMLWDDLAEIRSLATLKAYQRIGIAKQIVGFMKEEAKALGVSQIFTFTLLPAFFSGLGFQIVDRETIPSKLWNECSKCPKFFCCDETALFLTV